ncbi:unnamed protein product [Periconia digitata]|uniref:Secreted protein n=1 Tax=Periconia digitata TaxID=1303443 RepID=A0A9W4U453_9PLEO|nr:unnamed protein product [Periconia digitata]
MSALTITFMFLLTFLSLASTPASIPSRVVFNLIFLLFSLHLQLLLPQQQQQQLQQLQPQPQQQWQKPQSSPLPPPCRVELSAQAPAEWLDYGRVVSADASRLIPGLVARSRAAAAATSLPPLPAFWRCRALSLSTQRVVLRWFLRIASAPLSSTRIKPCF